MVTKNCIQLVLSGTLFVSAALVGTAIAQPKLPLDSLHPQPPKHIRVELRSVKEGDTLTLFVGAPASEHFTLNILTHGDSLLSSQQVTGGITVLPALPLGHYHFKLLSDSGTVVGQGKFDVHPKPTPRPKPLRVRVISDEDTVKLWIDTSASQNLTLLLKGHKDSVLATFQVHSGLNVLAGIAKGHYEFELVTDSGIVVFRGRLDVHSKPTPKPKPITARLLPGDSLRLLVEADSSKIFTLRLLNHQDSLLSTFTVHGGINPLSGIAVGHYHFELLNDTGAVVFNGKFDVHPIPTPKPKPLEVRIKGGDSLVVSINVPDSVHFVLRVLTHQDSLVSTFQVHGGTNVLPILPYDHYHYELVSDSGTVVKKGKFELHGPHVRAVVGPNPSFGGLRFLHIQAPETDHFTVLISDANMLVYTLQVTGGVTQLPVLSVGVYYYKVLDSNGQAVAKGRIMIME